MSEIRTHFAGCPPISFSSSGSPPAHQQLPVGKSSSRNFGASPVGCPCSSLGRWDLNSSQIFLKISPEVRSFDSQLFPHSYQPVGFFELACGSAPEAFGSALEPVAGAA